MKKLTILTSVLALAACGGGSGGGGAPSTVVTPGNILIPINDVQARNSNANISSSFSNEEKRRTVALNNYESADVDLPTISELDRTSGVTPHNAPIRSATSRASSAKSSKTNVITDALIDAMYENMHYWLVEKHIPTTIAGWIQYKHALILAGFLGFDYRSDNLEQEITEHFMTNPEKDDIISQADNLFTELGTLKTFDGTNIEWFSSPRKTIEDSEISINDKITFQIDPETKKVTGIDYAANDGVKSRENKISMERLGDDGNKYKASNVHLWSYGLKNIECVGGCPQDSLMTYDPSAHRDNPKGRTLEVTSVTELSTEEIKEKLLAEIELAYKEGYFDSFHNFVNGEHTQEEAALALKNEAIRRVNNWEHEDNKIEEHEIADIQNNLTTYGHLVGLAYSDFGTMDMLFNGEPDTTKIIYGGYKDKRIDVKDIETNMEFHGVAKGHVYASETRNHGENEILTEYPSVDLQDNNAKLVFNTTNQTETLTASFSNDNWYDVKVVKDSVNKPNITFTDNTKSGISDEYKFIGHANGKTYTVEDFTKTTTEFDHIGGYDNEQNKPVSGKDGMTGGSSGTLGIAYYGDNQKPSEAVGYVSYQESEPFQVDYNDERIKNIEFDMGFGMLKDMTTKDR